jgi:hypothetical protein
VLKSLHKIEKFDMTINEILTDRIGLGYAQLILDHDEDYLQERYFICDINGESIKVFDSMIYQ